MSDEVAAALVCALLAALGGLAVPRLIAMLPEPRQEPADPEQTESAAKRLYRDLASWRWLTPIAVLTGATCGASWGFALGWSPALLWLLPLIPVGTALGYIDARERLLPTRLIGPSYAVVVLCIVVGSALEGDVRPIVEGLVGWAVAGGLFWVLWRFTAGMGYGDVRLAGLLGMALGAVGIAELIVGIYAGFVIGFLGWVLLRLLGLVKGRSLAFGPAMLAGAWFGLIAGPTVIGLVNGG